MSLILSVLRKTPVILRANYTNRLNNSTVATRCFSKTSFLLEEENPTSSEQTKPVDPEKDRSKKHSPETSARYLASSAYQTTYGTDPVWKQYRRNHKGVFAPRKTRRTCIRNNVISTGNPCPICRDEYLVLDHRNPELLKQFISPYSGAILSYSKTGICQVKHQELLVAIARAKDYGIITYDVPFRRYDYSEWYKRESEA